MPDLFKVKKKKTFAKRGRLLEADRKRELEHIQLENEKEEQQLTLAQQIAKERFLANQEHTLEKDDDGLIELNLGQVDLPERQV